MSQSSGNTFVMTVDVDGWPSLLRFYGVDHDASQADAQVDVEAGVSRLLSLFEKHGISATFFVTGEMTRLHPNMVRLISAKGHEIACHGFVHLKNECLAEKDEQRRTIEKAATIIEDAAGVKPLGFRAPCLRANRDTFDVLSENGFLYDSSIIPTVIPGYYAYLNSNFRPHWLPSNSPSKEKPRSLLEIPVSVNPVLFIPLSAAWMRNLGAGWVKLGIKANFSLKNPVVFYVHPRDVLSLPRVKGVPWHLYRNVGFQTLRILDELIRYAKTLNASFVKAADLALAFHNSRGKTS